MLAQLLLSPRKKYFQIDWKEICRHLSSLLTFEQADSIHLHSDSEKRAHSSNSLASFPFELGHLNFSSDLDHLTPTGKNYLLIRLTFFSRQMLA